MAERVGQRVQCGVHILPPFPQASQVVDHLGVIHLPDHRVVGNAGEQLKPLQPPRPVIEAAKVPEGGPYRSAGRSRSHPEGRLERASAQMVNNMLAGPTFDMKSHGGLC